MSKATSAKKNLSGAKAAMDGYEYQLDVSVYLALRLMLIRKSASRITIEPANDEDLEVDLEPDVPGRVEPHAMMTEGDVTPISHPAKTRVLG